MIRTRACLRTATVGERLLAMAVGQVHGWNMTNGIASKLTPTGEERIQG